MVKVGRYEVPEDWPVKGEAGRTFNEKLRNGFFSAYMAGDVTLDVGYRGAFEDAVPILPHAIGVDLDYPGYDGKTLPFADESVDTVYSSHMLEHVVDFRATIRDWHRVVKPAGFIVCVVPHQFLYEKKRGLPSFWNADHKRFYTPASLLREFEASLRPNTYRVRHLRDSDENYTYGTGPEAHSGGGYEIELVVQKIAPPEWDLAGPADPLQDGCEGARNELSRLTAERTRSRASAPGGSTRQSWRRQSRFPNLRVSAEHGGFEALLGCFASAARLPRRRLPTAPTAGENGSEPRGSTSMRSYRIRPCPGFGFSWGIL